MKAWTKIGRIIVKDDGAIEHSTPIKLTGFDPYFESANVHGIAEWKWDARTQQFEIAFLLVHSESIYQSARTHRLNMPSKAAARMPLIHLIKALKELVIAFGAKTIRAQTHLNLDGRIFNGITFQRDKRNLFFYSLDLILSMSMRSFAMIPKGRCFTFPRYRYYTGKVRRHVS